MDNRYLVAIASLGPLLETARTEAVTAIVGLGHFPIDLTATGLLSGASPDLVERQVERSDYLCLLVAPGDTAPTIRQVQQAHDVASERGIPVLVFVRNDDVPEEAGGAGAAEALAEFVDHLRTNPLAVVEGLPDTVEGMAWTLSRVTDTYPRPGWVSAAEVPTEDVANELSRLMKENRQLRENQQGPAGAAERNARMEEISEVLHKNKILIPLWSRGTATWEKPVEVTLHDFFIRLAPEMVVERSTADAADFIPIGVCQLDPQDVESGWAVPPNSLNLWLTDLMAVGLIEPSQIRHHAKDTHQYWTLTPDGREFLARERRSVLDEGGHRHVGMTQEYSIAMLRGQIPDEE